MKFELYKTSDQKNITEIHLDTLDDLISILDNELKVGNYSYADILVGKYKDTGKLTIEIIDDYIN